MPGLWSRFKVWSSGEVLTASDLNSEFNNVITNSVAQQIDDYSTNTAQMQVQTDPYPSAAVSLATALSGELERIRYQLAQITGNSFWYEDPVVNLASISQSSLTGLKLGIEFEGARGGASTTTDVLSRFINQGGIINAASLSSADVTASDFDSTNFKFGTYGYICGAGNILALPNYSANPVKGTLTSWFRNLAAADYIAYNPLIGVEMFLDSVSGRLTAKITEDIAATESTKASSTVQGSATRSGDTTFHNAIMRWRVGDEAGASTDLLELLYDGSNEGTQLASQDFDVNQGMGGVWFMGCKPNLPAWDHFYAASGLPTSHSDAWTSTGTPGASVSNGVLTISVDAATSGFYSKTNNIDLSQFTARIKMKVDSTAKATLSGAGGVFFTVRDDSLNRRVSLKFSESTVSLIFNGSTNQVAYEMELNTKEWNIYHLTCEGASPVVKLYVHDVLVYSGTNSNVDATAADLIAFGDQTGTEPGVSSWAYVAYYDAGAVPPVAANSQGNLDSIGVVNRIISSAEVAALQTSPASQVFSAAPSYGVYLPAPAVFRREGFTISTTSTSFGDLEDYVFYIPGDGVTKFEVTMRAGVVSTTGANETTVGIDVDNDLVGASLNLYPGGSVFQSAASNGDGTVVASRLITLSPGLHEIRPQWKVSAGTSTLSDGGALTNWVCSVNKSYDL